MILCIYRAVRDVVPADSQPKRGKHPVRIHTHTHYTTRAYCTIIIVPWRSFFCRQNGPYILYVITITMFVCT